jgi:hypothetical protein
LPATAGAAGTSAISGTAFKDTNRNGTQDAGEAPMSGQGIYLLDSTGANQLGYTATDSAGHYSFSGIGNGSYRVDYDPADWWAIRQDWVPTTTGSLSPRKSVDLVGSATVDFGWRQIVRSTDPSAPVSSYTGSNGLRVESFDDVVTAKGIYDDLMGGSLVGAEASTVKIRFDYGSNPDMCAVSVSGSPGSYSNYQAGIDVAWLAWLDNGDSVLFHEYGHAWSLYYAYMMQQDTSLNSYLQARGIQGDSRLDSSHAWNRRELIAEDYRQLFGTANAKSVQQENRDLPAASAVPGLRDFLAGAYMQAPPSSPPPPPPPPPTTPPPAPALTVSNLAMNPNPVKTTGTASFSLSGAASVTASIRDSKGNLVRTLLQGAAKPSGTSSVAWDRRNSAGQKVKAGSYTLVVDATDSSGAHATASAAFSAS